MFTNDSGLNPFNQDISSWDTSNVTLFQGTFQRSAFNQDISGWDTSSATTLEFMFFNNIVFNQDVSGWDISTATDLTSFLDGSTAFSTANYDLLLNGWSLLTVNTGLDIVVDATYTIATSQTARDILTDPPNSWIITDLGGV